MSDVTLTADRIMAMPAGGEMDELVATRVLGWEDRGFSWYTASGRYVGRNPPLLSDNLGAAEPVLDWLKKQWGALSIYYWQNGDVSVCQYTPSAATRNAIAPTLPLALCRAALLETLSKETP